MSVIMNMIEVLTHQWATGSFILEHFKMTVESG